MFILFFLSLYLWSLSPRLQLDENFFAPYSDLCDITTPHHFSRYSSSSPAMMGCLHPQFYQSHPHLKDNIIAENARNLFISEWNSLSQLTDDNWAEQDIAIHPLGAIFIPIYLKEDFCYQSFLNVLDSEFDDICALPTILESDTVHTQIRDMNHLKEKAIWAHFLGKISRTDCDFLITISCINMVSYLRNKTLEPHSFTLPVHAALTEKLSYQKVPALGGEYFHPLLTKDGEPTDILHQMKEQFYTSIREETFTLPDISLHYLQEYEENIWNDFIFSLKDLPPRYRVVSHLALYPQALPDVIPSPHFSDKQDWLFLSKTSTYSDPTPNTYFALPLPTLELFLSCIAHYSNTVPPKIIPTLGYFESPLFFSWFCENHYRPLLCHDPSTQYNPITIHTHIRHPISAFIHDLTHSLVLVVSQLGRQGGAPFFLSSNTHVLPHLLPHLDLNQEMIGGIIGDFCEFFGAHLSRFKVENEYIDIPFQDLLKKILSSFLHAYPSAEFDLEETLTHCLSSARLPYDTMEPLLKHVYWRRYHHITTQQHQLKPLPCEDVPHKNHPPRHHRTVLSRTQAFSPPPPAVNTIIFFPKSSKVSHDKEEKKDPSPSPHTPSHEQKDTSNQSSFQPLSLPPIYTILGSDRSSLSDINCENVRFFVKLLPFKLSHDKKEKQDPSSSPHTPSHEQKDTSNQSSFQPLSLPPIYTILGSDRSSLSDINCENVHFFVKRLPFKGKKHKLKDQPDTDFPSINLHHLPKNSFQIFTPPSASISYFQSFA